ncbi:flagellar basal body rod protein FlgC [Paraphotobacterium marinum]|uniref:Flagellar basal-body rod protein FlgC n=1 Tax=Paraphotobacterium marinum TaxID=1755811 RepID=A0A220VBH0_9GAMM|nr:flagellar basal body rod protein FlgC [Paraphotobacterium marinum]ASK77630.1 flagellar basal body rod protein FlgC [Paraphotobacterium marinum]
MAFNDIYNIAGTAMNAQTVRLNTIASNLANADAASSTPNGAYQSLKPVFATIYGKNQYDVQKNSYPSAEVRVVDVIQVPGSVDKKYEPNNPLSNEDGFVFYPGIDVVSEMTDMMSASRSFETNVEVLNNVKSMQQGLLRLGREG